MYYLTLRCPDMPIHAVLSVVMTTRHGIVFRDSATLKLNTTFLVDLQWLLVCPFLAMVAILLLLHGYPAVDLLPVTHRDKTSWVGVLLYVPIQTDWVRLLYVNIQTSAGFAYRDKTSWVGVLLYVTVQTDWVKPMSVTYRDETSWVTMLYVTVQTRWVILLYITVTAQFRLLLVTYCDKTSCVGMLYVTMQTGWVRFLPTIYRDKPCWVILVVCYRTEQQDQLSSIAVMLPYRLTQFRLLPVTFHDKTSCVRPLLVIHYDKTSWVALLYVTTIHTGCVRPIPVTHCDKTNWIALLYVTIQTSWVRLLSVTYKTNWIALLYVTVDTGWVRPRPVMTRPTIHSGSVRLLSVT